MEEWKTVVVNGEVCENYMVSNLGNVKSLNYLRTGKEKILKTAKRRDNYLYVCLSKDGKSKKYLVHRLVAETFIPKVEGKTYVDHIDGNRQNNVYTNLRWCSQKENCNFDLSRKHKSEAQKGEKSHMYGRTGALHPNSKAVLCLENGKIYESTREAERETGIYNHNISRCCNSKRKSAGGYTWKYIELLPCYNSEEVC